MSSPQLALCLEDPNAIAPLARVMVSASSGLDLKVGTSLEMVLQASSPPDLQLMVLDAAHLSPGVLETLTSVCPQVWIVLLADAVQDVMLESALRVPRLLGILGRIDGGARAMELSYLVRRLVSTRHPIPGTDELLDWGASSVTFRPKTTADRDQVVEAVESIAGRFGVPRRVAMNVSNAAHELLMNAMYDAPIDATGRSLYASDRAAIISLQEHEIPTLRLTVDSHYLALDVSDPFGRLSRAKLFGGLVRGRAGAIDRSGGGAGLGLHRLFMSASVLRAEVASGRQTLVSWILDRRVDQMAQRTQARSIYYLGVR